MLDLELLLLCCSAARLLGCSAALAARLLGCSAARLLHCHTKRSCYISASACFLLHAIYHTDRLADACVWVSNPMLTLCWDLC